MEIPSKYNPQSTESHWYEYWMKNGYFHSVPDEREPQSIGRNSKSKDKCLKTLLSAPSPLIPYTFKTNYLK